jgi:uncharacterized RDD family membrane protein YckC
MIEPLWNFFFGRGSTRLMWFIFTFACFLAYVFINVVFLGRGESAVTPEAIAVATVLLFVCAIRSQKETVTERMDLNEGEIVAVFSPSPRTAPPPERDVHDSTQPLFDGQLALKPATGGLIPQLTGHRPFKPVRCLRTQRELFDNVAVLSPQICNSCGSLMARAAERCSRCGRSQHEIVDNRSARRQERRVREGSKGQLPLDFLPPLPTKPRHLGSAVEAVMFCEFPVATPLHRALAAALDLSIVVLAFGFLLLIFWLCGGSISFSKASLTFLGCVFLVIGFLYGLWFALAGADTPGMTWTQLRITTFDGLPPNRKQRIGRFVGACISRLTLLGLLWALADEESLSWHDHLSRTFPTPGNLDRAVVWRQ